MDIQGNNVEHTPFKIIFSNINCKITLLDSAVFAFVIRLGKKSSKYTQKKSIQNNFLQFDNILEVPFDDKLLTNQNVRKQKCEIMLYKFKFDREKQSKQLIGMASVAVGNEMFDEQSKKLRLTNSFDKEAYVQCMIKIQLGEADVLSHNQSRMSSFFIKSQQHSIIQMSSDSRLKEVKQTSAKNEVRVGLLTSNSGKSIGFASEQIKQENSFIQILNGQSQCINKNPKSQSKSETQLVSMSQPTAGSEQQINSRKELQQEKQNLQQICGNLQYQNQVLMNKIENLENQMLNQGIVSNRSYVSTDNHHIPRPAGTIKRSPMIKKNATITVTPSFEKDNINGQLHEISINQKQPQLKTQNSSEFLQLTKSPRIKVNGIKTIDQQHSPYFSNKESIRQSENAFRQTFEANSHMTFAGQKFASKNQGLSIKQVIGVTYTPPVNRPPNHDISYNDRQNSILHSVSDVERKNSRSYAKFTGKKKYQMIGAIKSPDQSQNISYFECQSQANYANKGGSIIVSKPSLKNKNEQQSLIHGRFDKPNPFNNVKTEIASPMANNQNIFLDFLNEKDENPFIKNINEALEGVLRPDDIKENILNDRTVELGGYNSRVTLEQLDMKTQEKFRKNQRALKIANMKILEENIALKKEKKILEQKIHHKKELSHDDFITLKNQIGVLTHQLEISHKVKTESESKLNELSGKLSSLEQENLRLKKQLKQQRSKFEYYLKMSNINDDKEKQHHGFSDLSLTSKRTSIKQQLDNVNSADLTKSGSKNQPNITSILNLNKDESAQRKSVVDSKSLKKVQFAFQSKAQDDQKTQNTHIEGQKKNDHNVIKPDIPKPTSSMAVSKLKQHLKPGIPKPPTNGQHNTSMSGQGHQSFSTPRGSGLMSSFMGGLSGTGETIIRDSVKANSSFSQK